MCVYLHLYISGYREKIQLLEHLVSAFPRVTVLYSLMQNASLTWVNEMDNRVVGHIFYFISLKNILLNLFSLSSRFS